MPIYGFECAACGHQFDRLQKMSDPDPTACPECGAPNVKRQLTAPSFRLSGSGWYETDFKKDGDKKRNLTEQSDAPKSDTKTETAPAAKATESTPAAKSVEKSAESKPAQSKPADTKPAA
jgi:putative FmdB family regulatory protein